MKREREHDKRDKQPINTYISHCALKALSPWKLQLAIGSITFQQCPTLLSDLLEILETARKTHNCTIQYKYANSEYSGPIVDGKFLVIYLSQQNLNNIEQFNNFVLCPMQEYLSKANPKPLRTIVGSVPLISDHFNTQVPYFFIANDRKNQDMPSNAPGNYFKACKEREDHTRKQLRNAPAAITQLNPFTQLLEPELLPTQPLSFSFNGSLSTAEEEDAVCQRLGISKTLSKSREGLRKTLDTSTGTKDIDTTLSPIKRWISAPADPSSRGKW